MSSHTTIGAGGPARFFAVPTTAAQVVSLVRAAIGMGLDYIGIGKGSNLLVRDGGYDGLVIQVGGESLAARLVQPDRARRSGAFLYQAGEDRSRERAGPGSSSPSVSRARWAERFG